ncbi:MAG: glycosyl hydrolase 115 family protein, partial [Lachnospiraceae bacterium]|nr:glycosyl hydrolase 115 family protein [Lachnospiraceae bacterium]
AEKKVKTSDIAGKWEVYKYILLHTDDIKNLLLVVGSDKLATEYGLFNISELCGVSPLVYWADSVIPRKSTLKIEIDTKPTKEPSVKFRGFFINDEWPCYGNWTFEHFKGFTAEMYDHVFELLLRLKGNYLWPAMWSSSFAWDGPGLKSYELADEYGIYIGNSHHEPCLRAGEEYRHVRGPKSIYGDAWNYHANTKGITRFWKDSLDERGMFTSMVTVGMRGEADSTILGANATLKDNIDLLKDVITCQKKLIKETEKKYKKTFPQVLALYKEVEPFYYGDEKTEGLCDWDVLDDVILMLCEDNHGYLRTVPDDKMRKHPAGFGMYYHVDYHGDPISYEWINSSPLALMWEQMTQAYEYGVRSVWILNVGDLKHNEFPLSYFLNLAYDFDKYGTKAPNTCFEYTKKAIATHFGNTLSDAKVNEAAEILTETVRLNGYRRPEALNPMIYDSCHFHEAQRLLVRVSELEERLKAFEKGLKGDAKRAWYSLTGFQTRATIVLIRMHLFGGLNLLQAHQNLKIANETADIIKFQIAQDKALKKEWADFENHKWRGMELASHVGFTKWNEDGSRYPLMINVEPFDRPRLFVSRTDEEKIYDKIYGPCMRIKANDFEFEGNTT